MGARAERKKRAAEKRREKGLEYSHVFQAKYEDTEDLLAAEEHLRAHVEQDITNNPQEAHLYRSTYKLFMDMLVQGLKEAADKREEEEQAE